MSVPAYGLQRRTSIPHGIITHHPRTNPVFGPVFPCLMQPEIPLRAPIPGMDQAFNQPVFHDSPISLPQYVSPIDQWNDNAYLSPRWPAIPLLSSQGTDSPRIGYISRSRALEDAYHGYMQQLSTWRTFALSNCLSSSMPVPLMEMGPFLPPTATGHQAFALDLTTERSTTADPITNGEVSNSDPGEQSITRKRVAGLDFDLPVVDGKVVHRCDICDRSFTQMSNLRAHVRIHTGEKPYRCGECGRAFTQKAHLLKHGNVHTHRN